MRAMHWGKGKFRRPVRAVSVCKDGGMSLWSLRALGRFTRVLIACGVRFKPELTSPARFLYISTMKAIIQAGHSGRVLVPPEKRFLISDIRTSSS